MLAAFFDLLNNGLEVTVIVESIEGPEYIHSILGGPIYKSSCQIVGIVPIANQVLRSEQHGKGGFLNVAFQGAKTLPWILIEEAMHGVKGGTAPGFNSPKANLVHHFRYRNHVFGPPAGSKQGLMSVTKTQIHYFDRILCFRSVASVIHGGHFHLVAHCQFLL